MVQMSAVPDRSLAQRLAALERANAVRSHRAMLKREIKARRRSAVEVLRSPADEEREMKVIELLLAVPKWGRTKVHKVLSHQHIAPSRTIGGLTERQRHDLVCALGGRWLM